MYIFSHVKCFLHSQEKQLENVIIYKKVLLNLLVNDYLRLQDFQKQQKLTHGLYHGNLGHAY